MIKRVLLLGMAAVLLVASPAAAHEEINPKSVPINTPSFLTLTAANEQSQPITKVVVTAPPGLSFGEAVKSPSGWTAAKTDTTVTWTGGNIAPENFESYGFEINGATQPGTLTFKVSLTAGSDTEDVSVPITATAASGTPATSAAPPTTAATTPPTSAAVTTTTPPVTINEQAAAAEKKAEDANDKAGTALIVGIIALILGIAALVLAFVLRRSPSAAPTAPTASTGPSGPATTSAAPPDQDF